MSVKLSEMLKAKDASQISLDDIRQQVSELARTDSLFKPDSPNDLGPWVDTVIYKDGEWSAIISKNSKLWEIGFTIEKCKVTSLANETKEVKRKTEFVEATEPFKYCGEPVVNDAGEIVKCVEKQAGQAEAPEMLVCKDSGIPISTEKKWEFEKPTKLMWAPGGKSCITCGSAGRSLRIWVVGDKEGANKVQSMFEGLVAKSPRRAPFGCVEHHEEERAFTPKKFEWSDSPEPGIYCSAVPTKLGENNVNGKLHTSFSPCFLHDGRRAQAVCTECGEGVAKCSCDGVLEFPEGVRGSESNPAHIVGVSEKSVGSLTNWPAFKDILPLTAKEPDTTTKPKKVEPEPEKATEPEPKKITVETIYASCPPLNRQKPVNGPKVIGRVEKIFSPVGANGKPASR